MSNKPIRLIYLSIFLLLPFANLLAQTPRDLILSCMQEQNYTRLGKFAKDNVDKHTSLHELAILSKITGCKVLEKAVDLAKVLYGTNTELGISKGQFVQTALFLLTTDISGKTYLSPKETGLKDALEYDPETGYTFIILDRYPETFLGRGNKKQVYKAIHFSEKGCKVVARAEQAYPATAELKMYQYLEGSRGIVTAQASTTRKVNKKTYTAIYFDIYDGGLTADFCKEVLFSNYEIAAMASDAIAGLKTMHKQNLVHRDLHVKNYLISIPDGPEGKREIQMAITDLNRTISIKKAVGIAAQGWHLYLPPEGFLRAQMKGKDYFASDIYAMGCVFYRIFYHKDPPWQDSFLRGSKGLPPKLIKKTLIANLRKANESRRKELSSKTKRSATQELELMILTMCHENPKQRSTAARLHKKIEKIKAQLSKK